MLRIVYDTISSIFGKAAIWLETVSIRLSVAGRAKRQPRFVICPGLKEYLCLGETCQPRVNNIIAGLVPTETTQVAGG